VDRTGFAEPLNLPAGSYQHVRVSPDGKRLTFGTDDGTEANVYVYAPGSGTAMQRMTFDGHNRFPIWAADSRRVAFQSDRLGDRGIFWQAAEGGTAERLTKADDGTSHVPEAWAPTGDRLLYTVTKGSRVTLWTLSLKEKTSAPFGAVEASMPIGSVLSPDGMWIAYAVDNTVYVQPFPPNGSTYQISTTNAGHHPIWSSDGKELFYEPGQGQLTAVPVGTRPNSRSESRFPGGSLRIHRTRRLKKPRHRAGRPIHQSDLGRVDDAGSGNPCGPQLVRGAEAPRADEVGWCSKESDRAAGRSSPPRPADPAASPAASEPA
jgi:Tol biopolymer transport system component